jgi:1,4-dihydroxy-6-naphthoate synthase
VNKTIRLAFSPDSDDMFMFHALLEKEVRVPGLEFVAERADTESLNALAEKDAADVLAVSIARYPAIADRWLLLPHGMSVGRGYGPVVVANEKRTLEDLRGKRIGVPGLRTTANLVLRLVLPEFEAVVIPIAPFEKVFEALRAKTVDAAVLIHEGRLTYEREGFVLAADLGVEWEKQTRLPLPLGGNVIARALGAETIARVSSACSESIAWALANTQKVVDALLAKDARLDRAELVRYLDLYANSDTRALQPDVKQAVDVLLERGADRGLIPRVRAEYAP